MDQEIANPAQPMAAHRQLDAIAGDSASPEALSKLDNSVRALQTAGMSELLTAAIHAVKREDYKDGEKLALRALKLDSMCGIAWHILAITKEKRGALGASLKCYDAALKLLPDEDVLALDLGRLANRLGLQEIAAKLYYITLSKNPNSVEAINNLSNILRDLGRFDEAIEIILPIVEKYPEIPLVWNTLGTIVCNNGDPHTAINFFNEAIRLSPNPSYTLLHNRSYANLDIGNLHNAVADAELAIRLSPPPREKSSIKFGLAQSLLSIGDIKRGWRLYEERNSKHLKEIHCLFPIKKLKISEKFSNKRLLLSNEQGVGDEVIFADVLPDLIRQMETNGKLTLAVNPRLVSLFQRSFPEIEVGGHDTRRIEGKNYRTAPFISDWAEFDRWTPLGSMLPRLRNKIESFRSRPVLLKPDPARVAHWKSWLATLPAGAKVGITWKSMLQTGERLKYYSLFDAWRPVFETPGAVIVNMQYGECFDEIQHAASQFGVPMHVPPGIDLKLHLDDVAALSQALDVTIGAVNGNLQLAGATGSPIWMIQSGRSWSQLGAEHYPWHPQARVFLRGDYGDWDHLLEAIAGELGRCIRDGTGFARAN